MFVQSLMKLAIPPLLRTGVSALFLGFGASLSLAGDLHFGKVGLFNNDFLGDKRDRWQTGSYQKSVFVPMPTRRADGALELRARAQIVSPWSSGEQEMRDRPYSSVLSLGAFRHHNVQGFNSRTGVELILQGDQTGLPEFQNAVHRALGITDISYNPMGQDRHIADRLTGRAIAEFSRSAAISPQVSIRPYLLFAAGAEISATAGADLHLGLAPLSDALHTRDVVTGLALPARPISAAAFVAGWDAAYVDRSLHLPARSGVDVKHEQFRVRAGFEAKIGAVRLFAGQAWLSPQFQGQVTGQRIGMLAIGVAR